MNRAILFAFLTILIAPGSALAGFKKGNGEVQFSGNNLPTGTSHPSLPGTRNDNGTTKNGGQLNGGNAWAPHTKGKLDAG